MINFSDVLKRANENYGKFLTYVARTPYANPKVSGEVEAMGKAIVEAVNSALEGAEVVLKTESKIEQIQKEIEELKIKLTSLHNGEGLDG